VAYAPAMAHTPIRRVAALGGSAVLVLTLQAPASADDTFTHITTPTGPKTVLVDGTTPHLTISGTASAGVNQVDIYCTRGTDDPQDSQLIVAGVPVTIGSFSANPALPDLGSAGPVCRLQALPAGVQPDARATTAYTGPVLHVDTVTRTSVGSDTVDFALTAGNGGGQMTGDSASHCGDGSLAPLLPGLGAAHGAAGCVGSLGGTSGSLRVDGHPGLLPPAVSAFTNDTSVLSASFHATRTGRLTWTESAPLMRCTGTDVYPPPSRTECGSVVPTGVRYQRQGTLDVSGQVRLRDSFVSTDGHRHRLRVSYGMESTPPSTGSLGFAFPGRAFGFHGSQTGQVVSGLPNRAATILVRTDRFSAEGDPQAATRAITYSRRPARLAFSATDPTVFGMRYVLTVPRNAGARLGFTDSVAILTRTAQRLGRQAAAAMMPSPRITSPSRGAVLAGTRTVVKGVARAGANGLPVSVTVNGHGATLTRVSAARARFKAVFDEPPGKHRLTAVARDAGGNQRSTSITVRNK
jgi:hypothetical protein